MIYVLRYPLGKDRAFEVTGTGPLPTETVLERAAHAVAQLLGDPEAGVTLLDVLTLPEETQDAMGFHAEEISAEEEYIDGKILFADKVETHHYDEFLVKPLEIKVQEVAAYIQGYTCGHEFASGVEQCYGVSNKVAEEWARLYLSNEFESLVLAAFIEKMKNAENY